MGRPGEAEELMWFAMRVTYRRELEAKRLLDEKSVETIYTKTTMIRLDEF